MYFSNNSRCVLQKARLLSPNCLNSFGKNLSFKKPKDDPTKPPLRINIPNDDKDEFFMKKIPGTSLSPNSNDDVFQKSGEIHLSKVDDLLEESPNELQEHFEHLTSDRVGYTYKTVNSENLTDFKTNSEGVSLDSISNNDDIPFPNEKKVVESDKKEAFDKNLQTEKTWYILVDFHAKNNEIDILEKATFTGGKHGANSLRDRTIQQLKPRRSKIEKAERLLQQSKHFTKFPLNKLGRQPRRFEVHELEDEATYILYVKLNKQLQNKPSGAGRVPERELAIRAASNVEHLERYETDLEMKKPMDVEKRRKKHKKRKNEEIALSQIAVDKSFQESKVNSAVKLDKESEDPTKEVEEAGKNLSNAFVVSTSEGVYTPPLEEIKKAENGPNPEVFAAEDQKVYANYASNDQITEIPKMEDSTNVPDLEEPPQHFPDKITYPVTEIRDVTGEKKTAIPKHSEFSSAISDKVEATQENVIVQYNKIPPVLNQSKIRQLAVAENVHAIVNEAIPDETSDDAIKYSETAPSQSTHLSAEQQKNESGEEKKYLSIHNADDKPDNEFNENKPPNIRKASSQQEKSSVESPKNDVTDFQTCSSFVSIGRTETSTCPMPFGMALPPLLKEVLTTHLRPKFNFNEKWRNLSNDENYKSDSKIHKFSENSVLFPDKKSEEFDYESLFETKEQIIQKVINNEEETKEATAKCSEITKKADSSIDGLSVMKKVKEMVQLDLDNVVKIFDDGGSSSSEVKELSSVVVSTRTGWEVHRQELETQIAMRKNEMKLDMLRNEILGDENKSHPFKYLPSRKGSETVMQLPDEQINSVIMLNPKSNKFFICKEALAEAISSKTKEPLIEVIETLDVVAKRCVNAKDMKSGDSILVFDDETQSWRVDFSILEKRQRQFQLEEELAKRSELILETFEEIEKRQINTVPKPDSKEKKTFDYVNKEWKDIKNPNEKNTKSKYPFKDANAEDIRKKNSDLYDNLFMGKKKESGMDNPEKKAPGISSSKKESKSADSGDKKEISIQEPSKPDSRSKKPEEPESSSKHPESEKITKKKDDNFWESFLDMNILPKDISEIPKSPFKPAKESEKIISQKKPEIPAIKIKLPFQRKDSDVKKETEGETRQEIPKKIPPPSIPPPSSGKIEKPEIKAPPPSNQISKEDPKKTDLPKKPPKVDPPKSEISKIFPILDINKKIPKTDLPKSEPPKIDPSKAPPKSDPSKIDSSKTPPKLDSPNPLSKTDTPKAPPTSDSPKPPSKTDPPKATTPKSDSPKLDSPKPPSKSDPPKATTPKSDSKLDPPKPPSKPDPPKATTPKSDSPKLDSPKPPSKSDPPKTATPKSDSKLDPPKTPSKPEPPKTATPKSDSPKLDSPKTPSKPEPPKTATPKSDSKLDSPKTPSKPEPPKTAIPKSDSKLDSPKTPSKPEPPKTATPKSDSKLDSPKTPSKPEPPKTATPKSDSKLDSPKPSPKTDPPRTATPKSDSPKSPAKTLPSKTNEIKETKTPVGGKSASPQVHHYVSNKIVEISRVTGKEPAKTKTKIETVKLNIAPDSRLPSKITEINLNKKSEMKKSSKEVQKKMIEHKNPPDDSIKKSEEFTKEKQPLNNNLEKYRTPFSDPEYEEKPMQIKSDIASNPNLKKLDNWNKTLVLHDVMKPPENIETWLKDETDKMATLLLKILQEASDGKPRKKHLPVKTKPENPKKGNPYENIRKKQENTPESFLFRVRTVNFSLENESKKSLEEAKSIKTKKENEISTQSVKPIKPSKIVEEVKLPVQKNAIPTATITPSLKPYQLPSSLEERRNRTMPWEGENIGDFVPTPKESSQNAKIIVDLTEEIPGPEILKKISNTWKLFPVLDSQITVFTLFKLYQLVNIGKSFLNSSKSDLLRRNAFGKFFAKYGPIVNVKGPLSGNIVLIHKPEHLAAVFEQDSSIFVRSIFDSVEQVRKEADEKSQSCEIPTDWNSPVWNELKKATNDSALRGCERYLPSAEIAVDSLVGLIKKNRNSQDLVSQDFMQEIKRWSLEGLCSILFEKSFGFMEGRTPNTNWVIEPDKLYSAVEKATTCLNKCERGFQMWRLMPTPSAAGLSQACSSISAILMKQIHQAGINLKNKNDILRDGNLFRIRDLTLVESMLLNDGLTNDEINCNLTDFLLIGANMINSTMGFLLYNLALNIRVQNKLFLELKELLPSKHSQLDYNKLSSFKYLEACIKENFRLNMPIPIFYRLLQNDILLSNYFIPKGTYVVMDQRVSSQKEYLFEDPQKFLPERWLSENKWMMENESLASFPLCHGPRSDFAKKVIELQMFTFIAKIIRNFHVEYHYGEIQGTNNLINLPDQPLKLNFIERET